MCNVMAACWRLGQNLGLLGHPLILNEFCFGRSRCLSTIPFLLDDSMHLSLQRRRRPVAPAMTWPPAVAVNSNHPDLIGLGPEPGRKKKKPGIIYLSSIPQGFNVSRTTGFFAQYGRVGRVYLQPG